MASDCHSPVSFLLFYFFFTFLFMYVSLPNRTEAICWDELYRDWVHGNFSSGDTFWSCHFLLIESRAYHMIHNSIRYPHEWFITNGDVCSCAKLEEIDQNYWHLLRLPFSMVKSHLLHGLNNSFWEILVGCV